MRETRIPDLKIDPVSSRLNRIIENKRVENNDAVGKLNKLESSWKKLNKDVEKDIKTEFELLAVEEEAATEAVRNLKENRVRPKRKIFIISGKVIDAKNKVGLPGLRVKIEATDDETSVPIAETDTNFLGNYTTEISEEKLKKIARKFKKFLFLVFEEKKKLINSEDESFRLRAGKLIHSEDKSFRLSAGKVEHVILAVQEVNDIAPRVEAGKAVFDSIKGNAEVIGLRLENMRRAHSDVAAYAELTRVDIKKLSKELSVNPPIIDSVSGLVGDVGPGREGAIVDDSKGLPPVGMLTSRPGVKGRRPAKTKKKKSKASGKKTKKSPDKMKKTKNKPKKLQILEDINNLGKARANKLRKAKINDLKAFVRAGEKMLVRVLGKLDFKKMKKEARILMKKHK